MTDTVSESVCLSVSVGVSALTHIQRKRERGAIREMDAPNCKWQWMNECEFSHWWWWWLWLPENYPFAKCDKCLRSGECSKRRSKRRRKTEIAAQNWQTETETELAKRQTELWRTLSRASGETNGLHYVFTAAATRTATLCKFSTQFNAQYPRWQLIDPREKNREREEP